MCVAASNICLTCDATDTRYTVEQLTELNMEASVADAQLMMDPATVSVVQLPEGASAANPQAHVFENGAAAAGDSAMQLAVMNGQPAEDAAAAAASTAPGDTERKRRHKWGPPAAGEFATEEQKPKKRRSRWESSTDIVLASSKAGQIIIPGQLPKEVTICGGLKVIQLCVCILSGNETPCSCVSS